MNQEKGPPRETGIGKVFMNGRSQAVRLPKAFRLPGDQVRIRKVEGGILLEPVITDVDAWFREMDKHNALPFMEDGRDQPMMTGDGEEDLFT